MSYDLEILAKNHDALLLAEVAGWLHDMGKCADAFLKPQGMGFNAKCQGNPYVNPHKAIFDPDELQRLPYWHNLSPSRGQCSRLEEARDPTALWRTLDQQNIARSALDTKIVIQTCDEAEHETTIRELILWARPLVADKYDKFKRIFSAQVLLAAYLGQAHAAAHVEKEEVTNDASNTLLSSPFGYEHGKVVMLNSKLNSVLGELLVLLQSHRVSREQRREFIETVQKHFLYALGDTRRPENEVTLWDWSSIVAALYKAALAGALLGYQPEPNKLRWRLLSVRVDDVSFLGHVAKIPDLLARQSLLVDAFNRVRTLLEETYPLGTRVYQDENSSVYVVPNIAYLLDFLDAQGTSLRDLIHAEFAQGTVKGNAGLALTGEVIPLVELDGNEWWGQRPDRRKPSTDDEIPPISAILQRKVFTHADVGFVASQWTEIRADLCPVCGLRPQGPSKTALDHKVCDVCEGRREGRARAKEWADNLTTTIWIDEVADTNGRLALIVGQFDLTNWLSGDLVRTLPVPELDKILDPKEKTADKVAKNPSFARIRRVWETTKRFWEDIKNKSIPNICQACSRLEITGKFSVQTGQSLQENQAYELTIGDYRLPVFCKDITRLLFLTIDRLDYVLKRLNLHSVAELEKKLRRGEYELELPGEYDTKRQKIGTLGNINVKEEQAEYFPYIPILAEPRNFMALVPADKALGIINAIKSKYESEMSKVRNRLPLTLGAVYFGRHTPLAAALNAGRRMIDRHRISIQAQVTAVEPKDLLSDKWPKIVGLTLEIGERQVQVEVSTVMGDCTTHDVWYPYWEVKGKPTDRERWFIGPDDEHWVHVCDLKKGDKIVFAPSTFDYEYLDTSARRFEVSYKGGQRRGSDKRQRPYLLEELEQLEKVWKLIKSPRTSTSQIKALTALIESKRRDWQEPTGDSALALPDDDPFRQLCRNALANTTWHGNGWKDFSPEDRQLLDSAAINGMLADVLELYITLGNENDE